MPHRTNRHLSLCSSLTALLALVLFTNTAQSGITINLSQGTSLNGALFEIRGSANFSTLQASSSETGTEFISLGNHGILAVGNEWDGSINGTNSYLYSSLFNHPLSTIDLSGVDLTLGQEIRSESNSQGSLPHFGYSVSSKTLFWDDDYVDNTELNITEYMGANYLFADLLGPGAAVKTSTVTWDNGNESLTFIIGESVPEPSGALYLMSVFLLGLCRRTRA